MATLTKDCDLMQGYAPRPDGQQTYGYIRSLTINDVVLPADQIISRPLQPGSSTTTQSVVGVLDLANWLDTGPTQPIDFTARISAANRQQLASMLVSKLTKVIVSIDFVVNEYDPVVKQYYTSFKSNKGVAPSGAAQTTTPTTFGSSSSSPIYGVVAVVNGAVAVELGSTAQQDIPGFVDYQMTLRLGPAVASGPQQILVQTSPTNKLIKPFGLPPT